MRESKRLAAKYCAEEAGTRTQAFMLNAGQTCQLVPDGKAGLRWLACRMKRLATSQEKMIGWASIHRSTSSSAPV